MSDQLDLFDPDPSGVRPWVSQPGDPLGDLPPVPKGLYLGTSSWSFPGWQGLVYEKAYSEQRLAERGLEAYSQNPLFDCVSLDKTYYRPIERAEYARLAAQVPPTFQFVVKAPRDLLKPTLGDIDVERLQREFLLPAAQGLGSHLGPILFQFPPSVWREWGSRVTFCQALGRMVQDLPKEFRYCVEVRDEELLGPQLAEALSSSSVGLCASIHPQLPPMEKQLLAVPPNRGLPVMFRWNLRPSLEYTEAKEDFRPFNSLQSPDPQRRSSLARMIVRALQAERQVYVTVNNKAEGCAPLSLKKLLEELYRLGGALESNSKRVL